MSIAHLFKPTADVLRLATRPDGDANLLELLRVGNERASARRHAVQLEKIGNDIGVLRGREFSGIVIGHRRSQVIEQLGGTASAPC